MWVNRRKLFSRTARKQSSNSLDLQETGATNSATRLRKAEAKVQVNGETVSLIFSSNYRLPVTVAGVQIDCAVTKGYGQELPRRLAAATMPWGLVKDARLRLWPAGSPFINPGTFVYPAKQRWFASGTQMANEPLPMSMAGENPLQKSIYYHYGLDIGGSEGLVDVVAATDGLVVSSGKEVLPGYTR